MKPSPAAKRARSMLPHEHGAYAEIALPLVASIAASRPTLASACFVLAACAAFVAHEPALVLLGHRGPRARRESATTARRWLVGALALAAALGALGFALSPVARAWLALPIAFTAVAGVLVVRRDERTLAGELVACVALASAAVPTAIAGGLPWQEAIASWGAFCAAFTVSTVEVRSIAHRHVGGAARVIAWAAAGAIVAVLALTRPFLALTPIPVIAVVAFVVLRATSAAALRRLGWTLATSSLAMAAAVVVAIRASH